MNITIMYGGRSGEHDVSLKSASSVVRAISDEHTVHLIGIAQDGAWYLQPAQERDRVCSDTEAVVRIVCDEKKRVGVVPGGGTAGALYAGKTPIETDIVFGVLHGTFGEDGSIQGLFEMAELPYVGSDVTASGLAMDKEKVKLLWKASGLPVIPWKTIHKSEWLKTGVAAAAAAEQDFGYPLFVKPARAGSSVGASKVAARAGLSAALEYAFDWDDKVLIEVCIDAREVECSVMGNDELRVYPAGEIVPTHDFYSYDAKYCDPDGAHLKIPAEVTDEQMQTIMEFAKVAYRSLGLAGFSRVDFFIDKKTGALFLNEVNTIPGFTSISMFPKMCMAAGLSYSEIVMDLLLFGIKRFEASRQLKRRQE